MTENHTSPKGGVDVRLADCLVQADIHTLQAIARHYQFSCALYSKNEMIQEILHHFRINPQFQLEQTAQEYLQNPIYARLALHKTGFFAKEEIQAMFQSNPTDSLDLQEAISRGWLIPIRKYNGDTIYVLPDELREHLLYSVIDQMREKLVFHEDDENISLDKTSVLSDLHTFLQYTERHQVQLTVNGSIYKRQLTQILELMSTPEEIPVESWRFGYGRRFHDYPDRFALLYDFSYFTGLLEEQEVGQLIINSSHPWLQKGNYEQLQSLFEFYIRSYRRPLPRLPLILSLLIHLSESWVREDTVYEVIQHFLSDFYFDSKEQVWKQRILQMLHYLGIVHLHQETFSDSIHNWFQMSKLGLQLLLGDIKLSEEKIRPNATLHVHPNFEIVISSPTHPFFVELGRFAEMMESTESYLRFRITEQRVQDGLAAGYSLSDWLERLSKQTALAIPGNVERTLQKWSNRGIQKEVKSLIED
ncbi:hypothetical protein ACOJUR_09515 [Alicyclobacillus tolerans]|uniref:hypothetical protein n=1 Tax=Alicyclobacillus tolerans TaxID=90970 RepID=UPI001AF03A2A|nr:hypothetical protein FY534_06605 [Alicyclobacillus sp. TC]